VPQPPAQSLSQVPRVISAQHFADLDNSGIPVLLIDLSGNPVYSRQHIPGAVWLDFKALVTSRPPVVGLLPDIDKLAKTLGHSGITPDHLVIAYDDENGLKACRLLWTLDVIGHKHSALLDGGLEGWQQSRQQRENVPRDSAVKSLTTTYPATLHGEVIADRAYIESHLNDPATRLLDARTSAEYRGTDRRAARNGHIPGAINIEWSRCLDPDSGLYLRPTEQLHTLFHDQGITPDKEVISYCQTHRRSAFHYVILKHLGFERVRGYPGSWSEWGNLHDTPVE
jgi:thiosulfate/3-mercaptopyruvate sulfurtransferase